MVIECKRLPTPGGKDREREYVSGFHANGSPTGGIQRFKLGLHGGQVHDAAMIGYVVNGCLHPHSARLSLTQRTRCVGPVAGEVAAADDDSFGVPVTAGFDVGSAVAQGQAATTSVGFVGV